MKENNGVNVYVIKNEIYHLPESSSICMRKDGRVDYRGSKDNKWHITKKFKQINIPPDEIKQDYGEMSWLEICYLASKYSIELGEDLSVYKVAIYAALRMFYGYYANYKKLVDMINPKNQQDRDFFEMMRCDSKLAFFQVYSLDVIDMDNMFDKMDDDYDSNEATYKGRQCSMHDYVKIKYGIRYSWMIQKVLDQFDDKHDN